MGADLHIECLTHNLGSDEVGHNTTYLDSVRELIAGRAELLTAMGILVKFDLELDYEARERNAINFFINHPTCPLGIRDEYGRAYSIEKDAEPPKELFGGPYARKPLAVLDERGVVETEDGILIGGRLTPEGRRFFGLEEGDGETTT